MAAIHACFEVANNPSECCCLRSCSTDTPFKAGTRRLSDLEMLWMRSTICTQKESGTGAGSCIQNRLPVFLPFENGQAESMRPQTALLTRALLDLPGCSQLHIADLI